MNVISHLTKHFKNWYYLSLLDSLHHVYIKNELNLYISNGRGKMLVVVVRQQFFSPRMNYQMIENCLIYRGYLLSLL